MLLKETWGINMDIDEMLELALKFKPCFDWVPNPRDSSKVLGLFYKVVTNEQANEEIYASNTLFYLMSRSSRHTHLITSQFSFI